MKKIKFLSFAAIVISLAYCTSTKKTAEKTPVAAFTPNDKQIEIVQKRWPNSTIEEVKEGQNIFVTKCTECHKPYEITKFSEKKWLHEIDDMSPKAKLTAEEKLKLTKHILSYREANAVAKAN